MFLTMKIVIIELNIIVNFVLGLSVSITKKKKREEGVGGGGGLHGLGYSGISIV